MAVRTKKLTHGSITAAGTFSLYTAPAGETVIVKNVLLYGASGAAGNNVIFFVRSGGVSGPALTNQAINSGTIVEKQTWVVLHPGDELVVNTTSVGPLRYWVSGTELEGLAD